MSRHRAVAGIQAAEFKLKAKPRKKPRFWEDEEQVALATWAANHVRKYPEVEYLFHVPNQRINARENAKIVRMGAKRGVPDCHLPVSRRGYTGLWVELKAAPPQAYEVSEDQQRWLRFLRDNGACAEVCRGWIAAAELVEWYLDPRARLPRGGVHA